MSQTPTFYPPNPKNVPADLTELNWPYFLRALFVLGTLTIFVAIYFGLIVGCGYLCYASVNSFRDRFEVAKTVSKMDRSSRIADKKENSGFSRLLARHPVFPILTLLASSFLLFFLVKGFFKSRQNEKQIQVEITEEQQPKFFTFLRQLCKDTGAPMPARVFLVPDVNAAVTYNRTPLSLFVPTSKNLLIGLGLVNRLNLTEFKAVLAHEFGHFSQNSMKLGAYVYQANNIIADMVYGRDFFDDFLDRMGEGDARIDLFANCMKGVIWTVRKALEGLFHAINFANSSLCRQMEFNADLVAVTVAGSDAIVHSLAKLDFANDCLEQAFRDLTDAGDHKLYTCDLYYHQTKAVEYLKRVRKDPKLGEVPPLPEDAEQTTTLFEPGDDGIPLMWKTHPSNFDREQNVKRRYVRSFIDERSSWELFDNVEKLREEITAQYYRRIALVPADKLAPPETVQAFIDEEHDEITYPERFHGAYDNRLLDLIGWEGLVNVDMEMHDPAMLRELYAGLYGPALAALMEDKETLHKDLETLQKLREKWKPFTFRDQQYAAEDAPRLMDEMVKDLEEFDKRLGIFDRSVFQVHYVMAEQQDSTYAEELKSRYGFHASVQDIGRKLLDTMHSVDETLNELTGQRQLSQEYFQRMLHFFQEAHLTLKTCLDSAATLEIPKLKNMTPGQRLGAFLLTEPLISNLPNNAQTLEGKWTQLLCKQLSEVLDRVRRIHFKSLGGILSLQDQIAETWLKQHEPTADARPVPIG